MSRHDSTTGAAGIPLFTHNEEFITGYLEFVGPLIVDLPPAAFSPVPTCFRKTLVRLSAIAKQPSIATRDPTRSDSFSAVPPEAVYQTVALMKMIEQMQATKVGMISGGGKESWEEASWEEQVPWRRVILSLDSSAVLLTASERRFSERFDKARFSDSIDKCTETIAKAQGDIHEEVVESSVEDMSHVSTPIASRPSSPFVSVVNGRFRATTVGGE